MEYDPISPHISSAPVDTHEVGRFLHGPVLFPKSAPQHTPKVPPRCVFWEMVSFSQSVNKLFTSVGIATTRSVAVEVMLEGEEVGDFAADVAFGAIVFIAAMVVVVSGASAD